MINKISIVFYLLLLLSVQVILITHGHVHKEHNHDSEHNHHSEHNHNHIICKNIQRKVNIIELSPQDNRVLQSSDPHSFMIYPEYQNLDQSTSNGQIINRLFLIASKYFYTAIKVTTMSQSQTRYVSSSTSCSINNQGIVPNIYITSGFNPTIVDSIIFIETINDSDGYLAAASGCQLSRWPTYGVIVFNLNQISFSLTQQGYFHNNVYVTLHEMTHILGLSSNYYSQYYVSYNSTTRISSSSVVTTMQGRSFIITPRVKAYIQSYFGCTNSTIGAMLEDSGGSGSAGSHWERAIYLDELMTASAWSSGLRISPLTLNLLADTGFYYSVDTTFADNFTFGKGLGCSFPLQLSTSSPQYCSGSSIQCDYYGFSVGICSGADSFSSKRYVRSFANNLCNFPESSSNNSQNTFSTRSRCVNANFGSGSSPSCMIAQCISPTTVQYTIGSNTATCTSPITSIQLSGVTIQCPTNYNTYCSRKTCDNFCQGRGICVNGQCTFSNLTAIVLPPNDNNNNNNSNNSLNIGALIGIIVPVVVGVIILIGIIICCCIFCKRKSDAEPQVPPTSNKYMQNINMKTFQTSKNQLNNPYQNDQYRFGRQQAANQPQYLMAKK